MASCLHIPHMTPKLSNLKTTYAVQHQKPWYWYKLFIVYNEMSSENCGGIGKGTSSDQHIHDEEETLRDHDPTEYDYSLNYFYH